jgi:uncharacterized protein YjiS (DUF1127 family)
MSTMIPTTSRALVEFRHGFAVWLGRGLSRFELRNLSDRDLRDIGLSRADAYREAAKPFWRE